MSILILGPQATQSLLTTKLENSPALIFIFDSLNHYLDSKTDLKNLEAVFDCHGEPQTYRILAEQKAIGLDTNYFVNLLGKSGLVDFLEQIRIFIVNPNNVLSFGGAPFFLKTRALEIGISKDQFGQATEEFFHKHSLKACMIEDRASGFSPRVVCMIINEAYMALEEKIADADSIDLALQLGANYPQGPFEWSRQIGPNLVCAILEAAYHESQDARYKICTLLETAGRDSGDGISILNYEILF